MLCRKYSLVCVAVTCLLPACADDASTQAGPSDPSDAAGEAQADAARHDGSAGSQADAPHDVRLEAVADTGHHDSEPSEDAAPDASSAELTLGIDGTEFTYNGQPTFLLSASYYGGCMASTQTIQDDLARLASLKFNNIRVWATWGIDNLTPEQTSVLRPDGSLISERAQRLDLIVQTAQSLGMTVDVTFTIGWEGISDGGFDGYRTGIENITQRLAAYRNVFFDLGNERDIADSRYLSPEQIRDLAVAVRALDAGRLVTSSSGASTYGELYSVANVDFATPHFPRDASWASQTQARIEAMRDDLVQQGWDRPIYLQEEARRGYDSAEWPKSDFLTAATQAKAAHAAGWCFHTAAGFDLSSSSFFDNLDDVEADTIDELADAAGM